MNILYQIQVFSYTDLKFNIMCKELLILIEFFRKNCINLPLKLQLTNIIDNW